MNKSFASEMAPGLNCCWETAKLVALKNKQPKFLGYVSPPSDTSSVCNQYEADSLPGAASGPMQLGATKSPATLLSFLAAPEHLCTPVKAQ